MVTQHFSLKITVFSRVPGAATEFLMLIFHGAIRYVYFDAGYAGTYL